MIKRTACTLIILSIMLALLLPGFAQAVDPGELLLTETVGITPSAISETFTFSNNIPASPSYLTSSQKSVMKGSKLQVLISSSTNSKPVKMRVVNSSGTVLADWKSVSVGTTTTLWAAPANTNVKVHLQSTTGSTMTAKGSWVY